MAADRSVSFWVEDTGRPDRSVSFWVKILRRPDRSGSFWKRLRELSPLSPLVMEALENVQFNGKSLVVERSADNAYGYKFVCKKDED